MKTIDKYKKILTVLDDLEITDKILRFCDIRYAIACEELYEKFGFRGNVDVLFDTYLKLSEFEFLAKYGEKYRRTISWSDDGRQPDDEWLYVISFPTGPYIFGDDYPSNFFSVFFNELKTYGPKYIDTANKSLYFSYDNAYIIHDNFNEIFSKYKELSVIEYKKRKAERLRKELEELEG